MRAHPDLLGDLLPSPRLLVVRPDHLGDLLFAGPALARLRRSHPSAHVTLVVGPWNAELATRLPGVDRVHLLDFPYFNRRPDEPHWRRLARLARYALQLRRSGPYDAALVLRDDDYWSGWLLRLAGIPIRIGYDHPRLRPSLTLAVPRAAVPAHAVAANLALAAALDAQGLDEFLQEVRLDGAPERDPLICLPTSADRRAADALLAAVGGARAAAGSERTWRPIAVHAGSGAAVKLWRTGGWVAAVAELTEPSEPVVLTGGPGEVHLVARLATAVSAAGRRPMVLAGQTDVGTLAALFARCRLVLGPDSGPLHLAVAVGTPTVHLFGPADPLRFGPWGPQACHEVCLAELPCMPCGRLDWPDAAEHPCVRAIQAPTVVAAARRALGSAAGAGARA